MTIREKKINKFNIEKDDKKLVITLNKEGSEGSWYDREIITLRKASINLQCYECSNEIKKGESYIRDKFIFSGEYSDKQFKVNFICLNCWKGEVPTLTTENGD